MWETVITELSSYDVYEWLILITGLLYAFLSVLNKPSCWVFGIISCALLSYKDFTSYYLYFDGILQIFYVLLGFSGLYRWLVLKTASGAPKIFNLPTVSHLNALLLGTLVSVILVFIMQFFFNPAFAFLDSITTIFSIWATWLLVNRVYDTWYYWLVINTVYIYLYYSQGGMLVSVLYVVYLITAISGLIVWRKGTEFYNNVNASTKQ